MALYYGNGGTARQIKALYVGKNGANQRLSHVYTANGGTARRVFAAGRMLSEYALGATVRLPEQSGSALYRIWDTDYRSSGYYCLMRERVLPSPMAYDTVADTVDYEECDIDTYLTGTFFPSLPEDIRAAARSVDISPTYNISGGYNTGTPILRKIMIPSAREMGSEIGSGPAFAWWDAAIAAGADEITYGIARTESGYAASYWMRTWVEYDTRNRVTGRNGYFERKYADAGDCYIRPVLVLDRNYVVSAV